MTKLKFGVPCSYLKDKIKDVEVHCTNESEAMAIAAGSILAGKTPIVYMQNSGLGNIVDIVSSLYKPYAIPLPKLILSVRISPLHHEFMGKITNDLLKMLEYTNVEMVHQHEKNRSN